MTRQVPTNPNLRYLKQEAKDIQKQHKRGDESCCNVLRNLHPFEGKSDDEILSSPIGLQDVQFALALDYGFETWTQLKKHIEGLGANSPERTISGRDYSSVNLDGDIWLNDSFSLVMRETGRLLGKHSDYETIHALSGNAFAPAIRVEKEFCRGTMRMFGREKNIDVVVQHLGLSVEKIKFPENPPLPEPDEEGRTWGTPPFSEWLRQEKMRAADTIRTAMNDGVVVASGGWENHEWYLWGIITEVWTDGTIIGKTLGPPLVGDKDYCFMDHIQDYWVITEKQNAPPPPEQEFTTVLQRVVQNIRGKGPFTPGHIVYGLGAMDLWMEQMHKPAFQEEDPASSAFNASVNARLTLHGAHIAANYLRKNAALLPEPAAKHIQEAAMYYDRIAEMLKPYKDTEGYEAIVNDQAKQIQHAEQILQPVKNALAETANDLERALKSQ